MELALTKGLDLRYYQNEAVEAIFSSWNDGHTPLLLMATGTGKTIVMAEIIKQLVMDHDSRALLLAHRGVLLDQAQQKIYNQMNYWPEIEQAQQRANRRSSVVLASVQTMQNDRMASWNKDHFGTIMIDEAHHAPAKSYQNILEHFDSRLMGVTATADRADGKTLGSVFNHVAYEYPLDKAIQDGFLAPIKGHIVRDFNIDLSGLKIYRGDYSDDDLGEILESYIIPIVHNVNEQTRDKKTILFCPTIESSKLVAEGLQREGIAAEFIAGWMKPHEKKEIFYKFSQGIITHLCSCMILTEGVDEPSVEAIVMLSPTPSRSLYAQRVGRGTRLYPGKEACHLVDFTFTSQKLKLVTPFELIAHAGFEEAVRERAMKEVEEGSLDGFDILDTMRLAEEHEHSLGNMIMKALKKSYGFVEFDPVNLGALIGVDLTGEFDITYQGSKLRGTSTPKQKGILKRYNVADEELSKMTKAQASKLIDTLFANNYRPMQGPITDNQSRFLARNHVDPAGMTKAQASILISKIKEKQQ